MVNFLDYYRDQVSPADPFIDSTGTFRSGGQYDYRTFTTATYSQGAWSAGLRHRFLPSIKSADYATNPNTTVQGAGSYQHARCLRQLQINKTRSRCAAASTTCSTSIRRSWESTRAPRKPREATNAQYYDVLGRRYFMSVQLDF